MPEKPYYQDIKYRLQIPMMRRMISMKDSGLLNEIQMRWFSAGKPLEELYDTQSDPYQFHNLAKNSTYKKELAELKEALENWMKQAGDKNAIPEKILIKEMWNGKDAPPVTDPPVITKMEKGVTISCPTKGASIGFKINKKGETSLPGSWNIYTSGVIPLKPGDKLIVQAQRIGYDPSQSVFAF